MTRVPDYLRTTTNKYKGLITEKTAINYLRKKGFECFNFLRLHIRIHEFLREKMDFESYEEQKIQNLEQDLKRDLEAYSSKSPPKKNSEHYWQFETSGKSWEDFKKEKLEVTRWRIDQEPKILRKELIILRSWQEYFKPIENYRKWLRNEHYIPDFIAKSEDEVFMIEVKSRTDGKTALFREYQRKSLLKAQEFGFVPMLMIIPINLNIEIGEPELKIGKDF